MSRSADESAVEVLARIADFVPAAEDRAELAAMLEGHLDLLRSLGLDLGESDPITSFDPRWHG